MIREALRDNEYATSSRFVPESMKIVTQGLGIALQPDIPRWKKCRAGLIKAVTAKNVDISKESVILSEIHDMVCFLRDNENREFDFYKHTRRESINILMRLVCSIRFGKEMSQEYIEIDLPILQADLLSREYLRVHWDDNKHVEKIPQKHRQKKPRTDADRQPKTAENRRQDDRRTENPETERPHDTQTTTSSSEEELSDFGFSLFD